MRVNKIQIKLTADGSSTIYVPELDEHYHSVNGSLQESKHVFIDAGLNCIEKSNLAILEIGFGTGLNALLTIKEGALLDKNICYNAIELYPLPKDVIEKLNYSDFFSSKEIILYNIMHSVAWNKSNEITDIFKLKKICTDFSKESYDLSEKYDLIYFDAFAPDKQPEMWTQDIFDKLYGLTTNGGILVTYCAKGVVRRMLNKSGYTVERLPGPPGKREMLRAKKIFMTKD